MTTMQDNEMGGIGVTELELIERELPGDWRLIHVVGWLPFGDEGRWTDADGYAVVAPHILSYADVDYRISHAAALGATPREAVDRFRRKFHLGWR